MGFESLPPNRVQPYGSPNPGFISDVYGTRGTPFVHRVHEPKPGEESKAFDEEEHADASNEEGAQKRKQQTLQQDEREKLLKWAKLRGLFNLTLDDDGVYSFEINPSTGNVDLVELRSRTIVLTLSPEEIVTLWQQLDRHGGTFTDQAG
ncbi:MAG: hypothetical protein K2X01_05355 [Cyanobacteria bacterium]|nr:hypothetical protein [Cyanobacteriota bacterium]